MRRIPVIVIAVSLAVLTGCSTARGVVLEGDGSDVEPCVTVEGATVDVEDLERVAPVSCELTGISLRFPDGTLLEVSEGGGTGSSQPGDGSEYGFGTFASYGVAVYSDIPHEGRTWWGTPEGIRRLKYLEGLVDSYE